MAFQKSVHVHEIIHETIYVNSFPVPNKAVSVSVCCVPLLQSGVWSQLHVGCSGFKFTLSSQPLTHSREGLCACAVWLTIHQSGAPQIYVALLAQLFSKPKQGGLLWHT